MQVQLIFKQKPSGFGYDLTNLTHLKHLDDEGNFVRFEKHTPELIQRIQDVVIDLPEKLV